MPSLRTFSAILSARLEEPAIPQGVTPRGIEEYGIEGSERRVAQNGIGLWVLTCRPVMVATRAVSTESSSFFMCVFF